MVGRLRRADTDVEATTTGRPRALLGRGRRPLRPAEERGVFSAMKPTSGTHYPERRIMTYEYVKVERRGQVMMIGINRPQKANALNLQSMRELSRAYAEFDRDDSMRVAILHGVGNH